MPEQISKYPDVTLEVLEGAGALCGEGAPQKTPARVKEQSWRVGTASRAVRT